jgi:CSLREA domain-containing protein
MLRDFLRSVYTTPVLVLLLVFGLMSLPSPANHFFGIPTTNAGPASTFTVNSTGDGADSSVGDSVCNDGSGACTLRAAIQEANAVAGDDIINFAATLNGSTINLNTVLPNISGNLVINGPGSSQLTVQRSTAGGTPDFRIFNINAGNIVTISGLTISNGRVSDPSGPVSGGAILNDGTLTLNSSTVSANSATGVGGGIQNSGTLTVNSCTISGNTGGGIANNIFGGSPTVTVNSSSITGNTVAPAVLNNAANGTATLTINQSTISGNSNDNVAGGGGISNGAGSFTSRANLTVISSTISGNNARVGRGGGIYSAAVFGNATSTVTVTNSTISGNTCGGGGGGAIFHFSSGTGSTNNATLTNTTITGNTADGGGGIFSQSGSSVTTLTLNNTIVAGNSESSSTTPSDITTQDVIGVTGSFNLIGPGGSGGLMNGVDNNQVGVANPRLGPLANNGGTTLTHALLPNSPALDAGSNANLPPDTSDLDGDGNTTEPIPFDQRGAGLIRVVDSTDPDSTSTVDIGAFEAQVSLDELSDQTINEDTSLQFSFNVAGSITSVTATSANATLVPNDAAHIAVTGSGNTRTLTINPAADQFGIATITVSVNGSNGQPMSDAFTLGVTAINDAPSFTKGADQTVGNNAGLQTINNWATNISAGANESGQTVNFMVSDNTNPELFVVQPSVNQAGTLIFQPIGTTAGTAIITIFAQDNGGVANGGQDKSPSQTFNITVNALGGSIKLNAASITTTEDSGFTTATVVRTGDTTLAVKVDYNTSVEVRPCSTAVHLASQRCDFTAAAGTLNFAAGETTKTIVLLINQDSFVEGPEHFTLTLSNPTSFAVLTSPSEATITITDDATEPPTNPIDTADAFVRQHYHDFLNREGDPAGLAFWTNQITECQQPGATCNAEVRRINVSAAFFLSIEFQETGYFVYRMYKASFGNFPTTPVPIRLNDFIRDAPQVGRGVIIGEPGAEQLLENNKAAFALDFVSRAQFVAAYPTTLTPAQFVDALFTKAEVTPSTADRDAAINEFGGAGDTVDTAARARALRRVTDNSLLKQQEFNRAFVLMEYFGYLRRNPDETPEPGQNFDGYNFWLNKLNQFNGNFINAEMVKAFIVSGEYRQRFGP